MSLPSLQLASPSSVPIQRVPSRATNKLEMILLGSRSPAGGCHGNALTPSKSSNPDCVPSQRYPSGVCAIVEMSPLANPSRALQTVCAYWLMSREGSRANAQAFHETTTSNSVIVSARVGRIQLQIGPVFHILSDQQPGVHLKTTNTKVQFVIPDRIATIARTEVIT